jgi:hypothetical protein
LARARALVRGKAIGTVRWSHLSNAVSLETFKRFCICEGIIGGLTCDDTTKATHDSPAARSSKPFQAIQRFFFWALPSLTSEFKIMPFFWKRFSEE